MSRVISYGGWVLPDPDDKAINVGGDAEMNELTDAQIDAQIDAMPAGWEMDVAVAMEVMDFRWMKDSTNSARRILLPTRHRYLVLRPWIVPADGSEREATYPFEHVPRYSQDIAAAWQIIIHFNRTHHWRICSPFTPGEPWFAGFTPHGVTGWNGVPDVQASGETAEHAVSRACLKAVLRSKEAGR